VAVVLTPLIISPRSLCIAIDPARGAAISSRLASSVSTDRGVGYVVRWPALVPQRFPGGSSRRLRERGDPMTEPQGWFIVVEVGVLALVALVGLLRR
jgi:hypothetical protein